MSCTLWAPNSWCTCKFKANTKAKSLGTPSKPFSETICIKTCTPPAPAAAWTIAEGTIPAGSPFPWAIKKPWSHVPQAARQLPWPAFDNYGNLQNEALGPGRSCRILRYNLHLTGPSPLSKNAKHSQSPQLLQISKAQMEQNSTNGYKRDVPTSDSTKWLITTQVGMIRPIPEPRLRSYFSLRRSLNIFCRLLLRYHRDGNTCISMHVNPKKQSLQNWGAAHILKKNKALQNAYEWLWNWKGIFWCLMTLQW